MTIVFNICKAELLRGNLDLDSGGDDIRCLLAMTNTDLDTNPDSDTLSAATLDECDGANYGRVTLTGESVTLDDANDRAFADANDPVFSGLGNGARQVQLPHFYKHVTNDSDSIPLTSNDFAGTINPGGSDLTVEIAATGYLLLP